MFYTLLLIPVVPLILVYVFKTPLTQKIKDHILGFIIYYIIIAIVLLIVDYKKDGLFIINDFFASIFLIIGILISFGIFLTNRGFLPTNRAIDYIAKIPHHIPFSHAFKNYLFSLLKVDYKVKVLLKMPNRGNYNWILHQISAYNEIFSNDEVAKNLKSCVEFILLDSAEGDIKELFKKLETTRYNYIIITSLSTIFKEAIALREGLECKSRVKLIGALSSISNDKISDIINRDDDIIRVFPPDYDEAETAINFIFYKIVSSICINKECAQFNKKSSIIVLHSGSYGSAISRQCERLYQIEKKGLKYFTDNKDTNSAIINSIDYYSFNFNNQKFMNDADNNQELKELYESIKDSNIWFYIVGYEPNISTILKELNLILEENHKSSFLFCGTASMYSWRESILETISNSNNLKDKERYYLKLKICNSNMDKDAKQIGCEIEFNYKDNRLKIDEVLSQANLNISLTNYCNTEENYISILTKDSLKIAQEVIENPEKTLLSAKNSILNSYDREDTKLLVNGDSINQYEIEKMS